MAYKRIIGVLAVKGGRLVKSYGYSRWRPAGTLYTALKMLDRWLVDEIVILDISRRAGLDPSVLEQIKDAKVSTPLAFGGGIRSSSDVITLMDLGCDRFVVETVMFSDPGALKKISSISGLQALIGSVPLCSRNGEYEVWRPENAAGAGGKSPRIKLADLPSFLARVPVSEYFITAVDAEGTAGKFPQDLPASLRKLPAASVIWFGGLDGDSASSCLSDPVTSAVAFGNINHESEITLPNMRRSIFEEKPEADLRRTRRFLK